MTTTFLPADIEHEIWLPIAGYEGSYEVSNYGRIKSLERPVHNYIKRGRILKPSPRKRGAGKAVTSFAVNLGRSDLRRIHRLVLEAFVGPCPIGMEGCHNDGDCSNNKLQNLRWDTHIANVLDSINHGTKADPPVQKRGSNKRTWLNDDNVRCIKAEPYFPGVNQMLGKAFGISYMTAYRIRDLHNG
jgi:hypothetical protein